jgi:hypothetical protein
MCRLRLSIVRWEIRKKRVKTRHLLPRQLHLVYTRLLHEVGMTIIIFRYNFLDYKASIVSKNIIRDDWGYCKSLLFVKSANNMIDPGLPNICSIILAMNIFFKYFSGGWLLSQLFQKRSFIPDILFSYFCKYFSFFLISISYFWIYRLAFFSKYRRNIENKKNLTQ